MEKLCKDCVYFLPDKQECGRTASIDRVTGETVYEYCAVERYSGGLLWMDWIVNLLFWSCGPNGRFWIRGG